MRHFYSRALTGSAVIVVLGLFFRLIFARDPEGGVFLQAGNLERSGATALALKNYELIVTRHPNSAYAPRALQRIGDLLAAQGRENSDKDVLHKSVDAYVKLGRAYPNDAFALTALQNAGAIAAQDLEDRPLARGIYAQIIREHGQDSEIGAGAVVKLARLSIQEGDGTRAQKLLQEVLRRWSKNVNIGSEAQYFLGFCYETVQHKTDWAMRAYDQVIEAYPKSQWATEAQKQLGFLNFKITQGIQPSKRVLLNIQALPDDLETAGDSDNAMWNALRLALGARGLSGDATLLQGYSLAPFYAGLDINNPASVINLKTDLWSNVAAAAGLRFSVKGGGREDEALNDLQDALDAAQLSLVYWQNEGEPHWSLAVGYDSERGEVMLQDRGAQFDTLATKAWAPKWKVQSSFGKSYTLVSLQAPGNTPNPNLTPTPIPTPLPGQTPKPLVNGPPTFIWGLAPIKESAPIGRTAERASTLLLRAGTDTRLLNATALDYLANTIGAAAREANSTTPSVPVPEPTSTSSPIPAVEGSADNSVYDPAPTATPTAVAPETTATAGKQVERARKLWAFWNAPATNWITKRRNAAAWCRLAALKTNNAKFNKAADLFAQSAQALDNAALEARALDTATLGDHPVALENIARECRKARDAERQAAQILG